MTVRCNVSIRSGRDVNRRASFCQARPPVATSLGGYSGSGCRPWAAPRTRCAGPGGEPRSRCAAGSAGWASGRRGGPGARAEARGGRPSYVGCRGGRLRRSIGDLRASLCFIFDPHPKHCISRLRDRPVASGRVGPFAHRRRHINKMPGLLVLENIDGALFCEHCGSYVELPDAEPLRCSSCEASCSFAGASRRTGAPAAPEARSPRALRRQTPHHSGTSARAG